MSPSGKVHAARPADSAGVPWAGRTLTDQAFAGDDGSAPAGVRAALEALGAALRTDTPDAEAVLRAKACVVAALAGSRLLVPIVAVLGEGQEAAAAEGDKNADMALVTLTGRDGRKALPAFTSVAACAAWDRRARPVPGEAARVAHVAVSEGFDVLVVDAAGPVPCVVGRPAVHALAEGGRWLPAPFDPAVRAAVADAVRPLAEVVDARCEPGRAAETAVVVTLVPGVNQADLDSAVAAVGRALAASAVVAERVDSLELRMRSA